MSASRHLQPGQWRQPQGAATPLKLFMSPREIEAEYEIPENFPAHKLGQAKRKDVNGKTQGYTDDGIRIEGQATGPSMYDDIGKNGVREPVRLYNNGGLKQLVNGHHRYFSQRAHDPDRLMPVVHSDDYLTAMHGRGMSDDGGDAKRLIDAMWEAHEAGR